MTANAVIARDEFTSAIRFAKRAAEKNSRIPILSNVCIHGTPLGISVVSTDLDRQIRINVGGKSSVFGLTLPCASLDTILKKANPSDTVLINVRNGDGELNLGALKTTLKGMPVDDFPVMSIAVPPKHSFSVNADELHRALSRVRFCISKEETRYYLNGVYISADQKRLTFVATDGHRLGRHVMPLPRGAKGMPPVIMPYAMVSDVIEACKLNKGASVTIKPCPTHIVVEIGGICMTAKTIDGTFPDYGRVIPEGNDKIATCERDDLINAIKSVSCVSSDHGRAVRLDISDNRIIAVMSNPDRGKAEQSIECEYNSDPLQIGMNYRYMLDILDNLDGEIVTIRLADAGSPTIFTGANSDLLFVQMPMRV